MLGYSVRFYSEIISTCVDVVLPGAPRLGSCIDQTRHNFSGEIRIFSVKICINPYPSFMHRCIAKTIAILCNKNQQPAAKNQNRSFTSRGATVGLGLRLLTRAIVLHGK